MTHTSSPAIASPNPPTEVLSCDTAADFLAALPRLVGFTAENSLFTVFFSGRRAASAIRVDLPADDDAETLRRFIDPLMETLLRVRESFGTSAPALVVSSATSFGECEGVPWRRLASRLRRRLALADWAPREFCCLAPDGWVSYLDQRAPARGRPLSEIAASSLAPASPSPTLATFGTQPAPSAARTAAVARALASADPLDTGTGTDTASATTSAAASHIERAQHDAIAALEALLAPKYPQPEVVAEAIRTIRGAHGWVAVFEACFDQARRASTEHSARVRLEHITDRLSECAALAPPPVRADLTAAVALAWWFRGLQSVALRELEVARRLDPEAMLPQLVEYFTRRARFPCEDESEHDSALWEDSSLFDNNGSPR